MYKNPIKELYADLKYKFLKIWVWSQNNIRKLKEKRSFGGQIEASIL